MDSYTEIRNKIRAMTGHKTPLLLTGRVESVDGETCSVSVGDNSGFAFRLCLFVFHPYRVHRNFVFFVGRGSHRYNPSSLRDFTCRRWRARCCRRLPIHGLYSAARMADSPTRSCAITCTWPTPRASATGNGPRSSSSWPTSGRRSLESDVKQGYSSRCFSIHPASFQRMMKPIMYPSIRFLN